MKIEIYQIGKVPPLTVVECDKWEIVFDNNMPRIIFFKDSRICSEFFLNNIAGFKEVESD